MTFRKGHRPYRPGDKYHESSGIHKDKPPHPPDNCGDTANVPHNLKSPQTNFPPNNFSATNANATANNANGEKLSSNNSGKSLNPPKGWVGGVTTDPNKKTPPGVIEWRPHNGPQTRFHLSRAYETLFGGTKGPGKTDTLLREGLRQIHIPNFRAIIFRRTYPNLREIIDRSHKYFGGIGGKFNSQDHRWTFPSGASYAFGHVQHEHDKYNHNGHEYHYIGFDEVTEFTETQYLFLMAQNRTSDNRIKCYIRATANPGGVGHGWVKKRFIDCLKPLELKYFKRVENDDVECASNDPHAVSREFIPATVYDNPSITENDPNYIKRLEQLPEEDKQALLYGNWDIFKGQFFKAWRRTIHVKEREVSKGFFKFIGIDYGYAAPSAVGWWMVDFDGNIHMYRELYKEGYTYTQLAEKIMEMTPEDEKIEYAVADPAIWGDRSHHGKDGIKGESGGETMQVIWKSFTALIKADNSRVIGWGRMRELLEPKQMKDGSFVARLTVSPNCKDFIRTVPSLIHDDKKAEDCNCFVSGTLIQTPNGLKRIEDFEYGDVVCTPIGNNKVIKSGISGYSEIWKIELSDGRYLEGTPDHKIYIEGKGLVAIKDTLVYDIPKERNKSWEKKLSSMVLNSQREKDVDTTNQTELFFQSVIQTFIEKFGLLQMERFLKDMQSITKIMIEKIMTFQILSLFQGLSIVSCIIKREKSLFKEHLKNGGNLILESQFCETMHKRCSIEHQKENYRANIVELLLKQNILTNIHAQKSATIKIKCSIIQRFVKYAEKNLNLKRMVQEQLKPVHISAVGFSGKKDNVYNLTVEKAHLYYANGFLVTNSDGEDHLADQARYSIMSRAETPYKLKFMSYTEVMEHKFDPFSKDEPDLDIVDSGGVFSD